MFIRTFENYFRHSYTYIKITKKKKNEKIRKKWKQKNQ
jgi:hypothetical protein